MIVMTAAGALTDPCLPLVNHLQTGGYYAGIYSLRLYDYFGDKSQIQWQVNMTHPRWYPTGTLMPSGKITIMGGTRVSKQGGQPCPVHGSCSDCILAKAC
jgi:hypothetical protein